MLINYWTSHMHICGGRCLFCSLPHKKKNNLWGNSGFYLWWSIFRGQYQYLSTWTWFCSELSSPVNVPGTYPLSSPIVRADPNRVRWSPLKLRNTRKVILKKTLYYCWVLFKTSSLQSCFLTKFTPPIKHRPDLFLLCLTSQVLRSHGLF